MTTDELMQLWSNGRVPDIKNDRQWVHALIARIEPKASTDISIDAQARAEYIDAVDALVTRLDLPPAYNYIRHAVAYYRLMDVWTSTGSPATDRDAFLAFVRMPRQTFPFRQPVADAYTAMLKLWDVARSRVPNSYPVPLELPAVSSSKDGELIMAGIKDLLRTAGEDLSFLTDHVHKDWLKQT